MDKIIAFLSGKKTTIATVIGFIITFCVGRGYIPQDTAELISAIMIALGLSANVATSAYYKSIK